MTMIGHNSRTMADKPNRGTTHSHSNVLGAPASSSFSSSSFAAGTKSTHRTSTLVRAANGSSGSDPTRFSSSTHHLHSADQYHGENHHQSHQKYQNHQNHQNQNHQSHRTSFSTRPDQALKTNHTNHVNHSSQPQSQSHAHASQEGQERIVRGVDKDGGLPSSSPVTADANFKAGMKLIQQAYEDRYQLLIDEANKWKWISEEQSVQMAAMAAELARVQESLGTLQKEMSQLETFRKAIVSMVDQHSGVSLTQLEQSILETIEADGEHVDAGYDVADADTSSFILDGDVESSFSPHQQKHDKEPLGSRGLRSAPVSTGTSRPRAATEVERTDDICQSCCLLVFNELNTFHVASGAGNTTTFGTFITHH
ncbi:hypothetical protein BG006_006578 [Podila minutissima]|uniref:Uncharacterized protein n=1 Tax=Podila minutissima TaxID=64525 RepID=A0A9P5SMD8_9FUNG|nr:hypothetical protein BG006_006578 [Podila minutissima]